MSFAAMSDASVQLHASLVEAAILNKYEGAVPKIRDLVSATHGEIANANEAAILAALRPIGSATDDIRNQTLLLALIEHFWSTPPKLDRPLTTLNCCSFGLTGEPVYRTEAHVEDYGGEVPTPQEEIRVRLDELERLCQHATNCMASSSVESQASILAYIVGALIRIHPFADGNGRTARLFIFYALRCWGLPLFPIPKVRNDPNWKAAMESAVAGDAMKLKDQLLRRMEEALRPHNGGKSQ